MANAPALPRLQFSVAGSPVVGGRLFTFINGTTSPATTYSNSAGTVPNTNPIILDAEGAATVYLNPLQTYTFRLETSAGALLWTQDGVTGTASDQVIQAKVDAAVAAAVPPAVAAAVPPAVEAAVSGQMLIIEQAVDGAEAAQAGAETALVAAVAARAETQSLYAATVATILADGHGYATKTEMNTDLTPVAGTLALVLDDDVDPGNNGIYVKIGASGSGSWLPQADPFVTFAQLEAISDTLSEQVLQTIGRPVDPIDGTAVSDLAFIFADPSLHASSLQSLKIFVKATGTLTIAKYTKLGTTMTRGATTMASLSTLGLVTLTAADFGAFPVAVGDYIAISGTGLFTYVGGTADGTGFYQVSASASSITVSAPLTSPQIQAQINMQYGQQIVTADTFSALQAQADEATAGLVTATAAANSALTIAQELSDTLSEQVLQTIGRPVDPIDGSASSDVFFVFEDAIARSGALQSLKLFVKAAGAVTIARYTRSGSVFTRVAAATFNATSTGLQTFTSAHFGVFEVAVGEYIGLVGYGVFSYTVAAADGSGWRQFPYGSSGTSATVITNTRLQVQWVLSGKQQIVTADSFVALQNSVSGFFSDPLKNKKIVAIGDSMVRGHTLTVAQTWLALIAARVGATYVNYGINGNYLSNTGTTPVISRYGSMDDDADYVLVFAGTNDAAGAGVPMGAASSSNTTEFNGALNVLIAGLITKYPAKKIGFITPYRRNSNYPAYVQAIKDRCAEHGVAVFDNIINGGVDWTNAAQVAAITLGDSYHLNVPGMVYVSSKYEAFIRSL